MRSVYNGLIWVGLVGALSAVVVAFERNTATMSGPGSAAPNHDPTGCRPCLTSVSLQGRPLPFEIDGANVRADLGPGPDDGSRMTDDQ